MMKYSRLTADQKQYADIAVSSAQLLVEIINDILDYSKIEQGHVKLEKIPGDFPATICLMYDAFYSRASSREVNLVRKIDTHLHHGYVELVVELLERWESSDLVFVAVRDAVLWSIRSENKKSKKIKMSLF